MNLHGGEHFINQVCTNHRGAETEREKDTILLPHHQENGFEPERFRESCILKKDLGFNYEQCRKTRWHIICDSWLHLIPIEACT